MTTTKFTNMIDSESHIDLATECFEYDKTFLESLKVTHKTVIKTEIKLQRQNNLEDILNVFMPLGYRYEVTSKCNNPKCVNPKHHIFIKKESKNISRSETQKALWADDEHRSDRVEKIKNTHMTSKLRKIHADTFKKMHENNYAFEDHEGNIYENIHKDNVIDQLRLGRKFLNRVCVYIYNDDLKVNKKFSVISEKNRNVVLQHLINGFQIGYNGEYKLVGTKYSESV